MKAKIDWQQGMLLKGTDESDHTLLMDAKSPIGKGQAPTPKDLVAFGLGGCSTMDVVAYLKKFKMTPASLSVNVDIVTSTGRTPAVFERADITFEVSGEVEIAKLVEAVHLSQTRFCGVAKMLGGAFPIYYHVRLNGEDVGSGQSHFQEEEKGHETK